MFFKKSTIFGRIGSTWVDSWKQPQFLSTEFFRKCSLIFISRYGCPWNNILKNAKRTIFTVWKITISNKFLKKSHVFAKEVFELYKIPPILLLLLFCEIHVYFGIFLKPGFVSLKTLRYLTGGIFFLIFEQKILKFYFLSIYYFLNNFSKASRKFGQKIFGYFF